ncbi:MAG TPA: DMT family transporter [Hyphomicrobiaceae bacterium]|nr:DMT family transporter [Hyphomicrobiaceae bacterium]
MANQPSHTGSDLARGTLLVAGAAIVWSFGGTIARFLEVSDSWTIVFWRSAFAALFLLVFMLVRDGVRGAAALVSGIGPAGIGVALCFTVASVSFVVALAHTTVANILLIQAGAPLLAALMTWVLFGERISASTWAAIAAVIAGIAIMVSGSFTGRVSLLGDGLALAIAIAVAAATVITRRYAHVRMTPAVFLAMVIAGGIAALMSTPAVVSGRDFALLFAFGALNLGLGLSLFVTGARLIPAALGALVGSIEPVLGPLWVWLVHAEVPGTRTLVGGALVVAALLAHLGLQWARQTGRT